MPVPAVTLRLTGAAPDERIHAWVRALGRVAAERRSLETDGALPEGLVDTLREAGVEPVAGTPTSYAPGEVVVLARAADLPTPSCLLLLVPAAAGTDEVVSTRVLPHGTVADGEPALESPPCVAIPAAAPDDLRRAATPEAAVTAAERSGTRVRRIDAAAVLSEPGADQPPPTPATYRREQPPCGHPAALPATALHQLMLATGVTPPALPVEQDRRPFLSVLTRTQGTRLQCLEEVLTCLAGQTSRDFEVLLACHRTSPDGLAAVRGVLDETPEWLRERVRVIEVERPGRSSPLNDALDASRGRYAVVLDDDDAVTAQWVAAFAALEVQQPGVVLRSVALAQPVRPVPVEDDRGPRGPVPVETEAAHRVWPASFSMVDHLWDNASPPMTFAIPRGVFADLGVRFDEALDTTEDWDVLLRAAAITGVASTPAVTAVYRVWGDGEGSRHLHDGAEWQAGREAVLAKIDELPLVLAPGAAREVRELHRALASETEEKFRFAALNEQAASDLRAVNEAVVALREQVADLKERNARLRRRLQ